MTTGRDTGGSAFIRDDSDSLTPGEYHIGSLSAHAREIVSLIMTGYASKSIVRGLGIAVGTVKNHRTHEFRKLSISFRPVSMRAVFT